MTYATAIANICMAHDNLSAAADHYDIRNDLCSTTMDILGACSSFSATAGPKSINLS